MLTHETEIASHEKLQALTHTLIPLCVRLIYTSGPFTNMDQLLSQHGQTIIWTNDG